MSSLFQTETDLIEAWLEPYTPHTQRTYQTDLHRFQSTVQKSLKKVTASDLQWFQETLHHLHVRSQTRIMATLSSLFGFAFRERFLPLDPTRGLPPRKPSALAEPQLLSDAQLTQLTAVASSPRNHTLLTLMYETGLTVGEVCRLQWNHIHLERKSAAFLLIESPQGSIRHLPLSAHLILLLQKLKESQEPSEFVFCSARSAPLHSSQVFRIVQEMGQKANLPERISPSRLRHSYAQRALAQGMPITELQYRLGHTTLSPTMRYLLSTTAKKHPRVSGPS